MPWGWKNVKSGEISKTAKALTREGLFVQANLKRVPLDGIYNGFRAVEIDENFNEITPAADNKADDEE
jgi:hypothetical protein